MNEQCDICQVKFNSDIKCITHNYCKECIEVYYLNKPFNCNLCFMKLYDFDINDYEFPEPCEYKNLVIRDKLHPHEILLWEQINDNHYTVMRNKYVDDKNIDELRKLIKKYNNTEHLFSNVLDDIFEYASETNNVDICTFCIKLGADDNC